MKIDEGIAGSIAREVLEALDAPTATAARVIDSLLAADRRGVGTHGLGLLPLYADLVNAGVIDPRSHPETEILSDSLARIDGRRAFGQLTGACAVDLGLKLVKRHGIAAVGVKDGTHLGRLGEWAERACDGGAVFLAFTNTSGGALNVAGADSGQRLLSTNPLAIGVPTFEALEHHMVIDFASSQVSGSRIRDIANAGGRLDPDWLVPLQGGETDDPQAFLDQSAALRPLGGRTAGHKGFGLMVAGEMLSALAGALMAGEGETAWFSNGALFCFLDASRFTDTREWGARARDFRDYLAERGARMPGSGGAVSMIYSEGQRELELAEHVVAGLLQLATKLDVDTRGLAVPAVGAGVTKGW